MSSPASARRPISRAAGRLLEANAERHLKPAAEMVRLFRDHPDAIAETLRFADRITFRSIELKYQLSRRAGAAGQDRAAASGRSDLAGRRHSISRRHRRQAARNACDKELALIAKARLRALFPHRARHRPLRALAAHPVPGPGIGGQFGRLLHARHHLGRSDRDRPSVRTLPLRGAPRAARHRRRFRAFAARGGDAICLSTAMAATAPPSSPPSSTTGRAAPSATSARRSGLTEDVTALLADTVWGSWGDGLSEMQVRQAGLDPQNPMIDQRGAARGRADRVSPPSVAACRRLRADPGPARRISCRSAMPRWTTAPSSNGTRTTSTRSG